MKITNPKLLKGNIIVTSPTGNNESYVSIRLQDKASRIIIADIKMTFEQFGLMLGKLTHVDCEIKLFQSENIGKKMEVKCECVDLKFCYDENFRALFLRAVKPFEVDGWVADKERSWNHHQSHGDGKYLVTFRRWVDEKEGDEV